MSEPTRISFEELMQYRGTEEGHRRALELDETEAAERVAEDERFAGLCLEGKVEGHLGARVIQEIVEKRMAACVRVTGMTTAALKKTDPEAYARLVAGHRKAITRAELVKSGDLTRKNLQWLQKREEARRRGQIATDFEAEIGGMFEEPERYP
jgi:hypothetical protein